MKETAATTSITHVPAHRAILWLPVIVATTAALLTTGVLPPWQTALWTTFALWAGFKWLVFEDTLRDHPPKGNTSVASARRAFWLWPGMDPLPFLRRAEGGHAAHWPTRRSWAIGAANTVVGATIVWGLARHVSDAWPVVKGWAFLVGLGLFVHCGLVHLAALVWQTRGVPARPIMHRPLAATSLADFWGRRWNTAFRDLAHRVVFRPMLRRYGPNAAVAAVFIFSGVVHDVAISIPAGAGYGLPTAYFLIQALGQKFERGRVERIAIRSTWRSRLFTAFVVIAPSGLLFHPPFLENVVLPLMHAVGAA